MAVTKRPYPHLMWMLDVTVSMMGTCFKLRRELPWPANAAELERIAAALNKYDRTALAEGDGDKLDDVLERNPQAKPLCRFIGDVYDGDLTQVFLSFNKNARCC